MNFRVEIEQEEDAVGSQKLLICPAFSPTEALRKRLRQKFKLLLFVS
jgi:hypothetical protein